MRVSLNTHYTARSIYKGIFMSVGLVPSPSSSYYPNSITPEYCSANEQETEAQEPDSAYGSGKVLFYMQKEPPEHKEKEYKYLRPWTEAEDVALRQLLITSSDYNGLLVAVKVLKSMGFERDVTGCGYRHLYLMQVERQKIIYGEENPINCSRQGCTSKWEKKDEDKLLRYVKRFQGREDCWIIIAGKLGKWGDIDCQAKYEELKSRKLISEGSVKQENHWTRRQLSLLKEYGDLYFNRAKCWELVANKINNRFTPAECAKMYPSVATFS